MQRKYRFTFKVNDDPKYLPDSISAWEEEDAIYFEWLWGTSECYHHLEPKDYDRFVEKLGSKKGTHPIDSIIGAVEAGNPHKVGTVLHEVTEADFTSFGD